MKLASLFLSGIALLSAGNLGAALISTDDFESYAAGSGLSGGTGGTGWGAPWSAQANTTVVNSSLSYTNGIVTSSGGGNALQTLFSGGAITDNQYSRALVMSQTGTVYMSLLFQDLVNPDLGDDFIQWGFDTGTANPRASIMRRNGQFQARSTTSAGNSSSGPSASPAGTTHLLVFKAEKSGGGNYDIISLFVDPSTFNEPGSADGISAVNSGLASFPNFVARSAFHELNDAFLIDNLRVGTSWLDVVTVPEPSRAVLVALGVFVSAFRRRR